MPPPDDPSILHAPPINATPTDSGMGKNRVCIVKPKTEVFRRYGHWLSPDAKLQAALDAALAAGPGSWQVPIAIVALNADGSRPLASYRGDEVHYSASLCKVAAMYAVFELQRVLQDLADELGEDTDVSQFLEQAASFINPQIKAKVASLPALAGVADAHALPKYASAYVAFKLLDLHIFTTGEIDQHLRAMIDVSVNASAGACIHAVGYGFLNGALEAAGLFDASTSTGLWLAGDYMQNYTAYPIPTVNDKTAAQSATVLALARLYTAIADRRLVGPNSCDKMLALLATPLAVPETFIDAGLSSDFKLTGTKVGLGPLKSGTDVYSECSIIQHDSGQRFVVAWQNLQWARDNGLNWICQVVRDTMRAYLP